MEQAKTVTESLDAFIKRCTTSDANKNRENAKWALYSYSDPNSYWGDAKLDAYGIGGELKMYHHSSLPAIVPEYVSELFDHPWHTEISSTEEKAKEMQKYITSFENKSGVRSAMMGAIQNAVVCGTGVVHLLSVEGGEPKAENVDNISSVFFDPSCQDDSCADADECAIVSWISEEKADKKYGVKQDVVKPNAGADKWAPEKYIAKYIYYKKVTKQQSELNPDTGIQELKDVETVWRYEIVGDKFISKPIDLGISTIPVVRIGGFKCLDKTGKHFIGLVQKTEMNQVRYDIAYSKAVSMQLKSPDFIISVNKSMVETTDSEGHTEENELGIKTLENGLVRSDRKPPVVITNSPTDVQVVNLAPAYESIKFEQDTYNASMVMDTGYISELSDTAETAVRQTARFNKCIAPLWVSLRSAVEHISEVYQQLFFHRTVEYVLEGGCDYVTNELAAQRNYLAAMEHCADADQGKVLMALYAKCSGDDVMYQSMLKTLPPNSILGVDTESEVGTIAAQLDETNAALEEKLQEVQSMNSTIESLNEQLKQMQETLDSTTVQNEATIRRLNNEIAKLRSELADGAVNREKKLAEIRNLDAKTDAENAKTAQQLASAVPAI